MEVNIAMEFQTQEEHVRRELATAGDQQAMVFTKCGRRLKCFIAYYEDGGDEVAIHNYRDFENLHVSTITNVHISRDSKSFGYRSRP